MRDLDELVGPGSLVAKSRLTGEGPAGSLPLTDELLLEHPSGTIFGLTQNAGMGWDPARALSPSILILSTQGGLPGNGPEPLALGYHTGHWELHRLVAAAAQTLKEKGYMPFAAFCSDPCDGRSQGTAAMMDSLPYRNDAAMVARRLIRSLPDRRGALAIASCDKGLPAMLMALAGCSDLPGVVVPGGVTLPARDAEDAGTVQSLGARYAHGMVSLEYASQMACRACGSLGGGCQFLGTAASAQVAAESLGLSLPHSALAPSGEPVWLELASRSALALLDLVDSGTPVSAVLSPAALENALLVHAAFGGSTNMLLHMPAIAHAAGLSVPSVADWKRANRSTPRLVDALPNGPRNHPTVQVFMAGGVPEVMLHLRQLGLLDLRVRTVSGYSLDDVLQWWSQSRRRHESRKRLLDEAHVDPDQVIFSPERARSEGLSSTVVFPTGNLAPQGSVVKATAIDPSLIHSGDTYHHRGLARVFTSEAAAVRAIKQNQLQAGQVLVLIGIGPLGTGMEEIYQVTSALKFVPWGPRVPVVTDGRFSGVSTGPCIGHVGPEALAGGPIAKVRDGDIVEIIIDRPGLRASVDLVETVEGDISKESILARMAERSPHPDLRENPALPSDTRLWAALQSVSGGTWAGAVYDVERIITTLEAGRRVQSREVEYGDQGSK